MIIKSVHLKNFKRFDDLTINLGDTPRKIVALVGPNGCGKSSVFDAFEEKLKDYKGASSNEDNSYFSKLWHSIFPDKKTLSYNKNNSIAITRIDGVTNFDKKSFYIRSAYRFTSKLKVESIKAQPDIIEDHNRPYSSNALDSRMQGNYERLLAKLLYEFEQGDKTGTQLKNEFLDKINNILNKILNVKISSLGNVGEGKGQLFFEKESSKDFPYENLSSGEKEVVDIIIDLIMKTPNFNDTVYCIDEPELHLNTAIQRKLLIEIEKLIPDSCQLWVATHSIGFLRALQEELKAKSQVLDFSEKDYFNSTCEIKPMTTTRKNWQRIFQTALEDLTGLLSPKKIIYCEGRKDVGINNQELGIDADIYNEIYSEEQHDTLFISSGGGQEVEKNASLALKILSKAFTGVELFLLKDRDVTSDSDRQIFLTADQTHRMLDRREIENYIFDIEVLKKFCIHESKVFDEIKYNSKVTDINLQDLKPIQQEIQASCNTSGMISDFKRNLAKFITADMEVYKKLSGVIF